MNPPITPPSEARAGWSKAPIEGVGFSKNQPPIVPGVKVKDLPTPVLLLDMDSMERNLSRMAEFFRDKPAKLRPHFKSQQVVELAHRQIAAGASGMTCARLEQAEMLVDQGIKNILIANEIAGSVQIRHFVELSHREPVIVAVDSASVVAEMAAIAGSRAHELNVVVDLNVRVGRCGVQPGEAALSLAKTVLSKGLRFRGLMGYEGHIALPAGPEKQTVTYDALQRLIDTKALLEREGLPVEIVTCGGTSDYSEAAAFPGVTEVQAGSYLLMDTWYAPHAADFQPTLTVLATVISKSVGQQAGGRCGSQGTEPRKRVTSNQRIARAQGEGSPQRTHPDGYSGSVRSRRGGRPDRDLGQYPRPDPAPAQLHFWDEELQGGRGFPSCPLKCSWRSVKSRARVDTPV